MRLLFVADPHGSNAVVRKSIRAARECGASVLILAGDLCGKQLVPLVRTGAGSYRVSLRGRSEEVPASGVAAAAGELADQGAYLHECSAAELESLRHDPGAVEQLFRERILDRLAEWSRLLATGLDLGAVQVFVTPGNDDPPEVDELLRSFEAVGIHSQAGEPHSVGGCELITLDHSNPTPWETPREASEEKLRALIRERVARLASPGRAIFNFHVPPVGTKLDLAPRLDRDLKPVLETGVDNHVHVGSRAVRDGIAAVQPLLGLHGHVHEAAGEAWLGRTLCLNPGSEYWAGILHGYLVDVGDAGITGYFHLEA